MSKSPMYSVQLAVLNVVLDTLKATKMRLPYSEVSRLVGLPARSSTFFELLNTTMKEDHLLSVPLRCSLVVLRDTGIPGAAYFTQASALGYHIPPGFEANFHEDQLIQLGVDPLRSLNW